MRTTILAILCVVGAFSPLEAATYYVRKTGNNSNTGTLPSQAWLTIDKAADTAVAGDIVYVGAGTYNEQVTPNNDGTVANPIRYYADTAGAHTGDAGAVIINGGGNARALDASDDNYQHWYDFKFTGGTQAAINWASGVGGYLQGCEIYSSSSDGIVARSGANLTVYQCIIRDNVDYGIEVIDGATLTIDQCMVQRNTKGGIGAYGNAANVSNIRHCTVSDNPAHGIYIEQGTSTISNVLVRNNSQHGIYLSTSGTLTLWHATSIYNTQSGVSVAGGTANVRNSICAFNNNYGFLRTAGTLSHTYNCSHGNSWGNFSGTAQSTGETTADPRFWSVSCFELQDGSPCINAGINPGGAVTDDLELVARPSGGGYDMGCYETVTLNFANLVAAYTALNPYAWWRLNETSGSTAVDQMSVRDGTYQNGVALNQLGAPFGGYNKAASFDGVNDKVNLSTINPTVTSMSFVGWIKADSFSVSNADYIAKASGTADSNYYWSLGSVNVGGQQRVQFRFRAGGATAVVAASSGNMSTDTWVFVAGVFDGSAAIIYKDGIEVGRTSRSGMPDLSGATNAAIGDNPVGGRPFDGLIDEVAIFTKALTPREISAIYASSLKGSITNGVVPKLWGIDEDDATLFAFTNYSNLATLVSYGRLKWNNGGTLTDLVNNSNVSSLAIDRQGRAYMTSDTSLGGNTAPLLLSLDLNTASTTQPNVVSIVGSIPTSTEIRGLAFDPTNDDLYALRSDGRLFVISKTDASIVRNVGQITGMGDVVTTGEDLTFDPFGNLYVVDDADDEFYRINKANGAIIEAISGGSFGSLRSLAWDAVNGRILIGETSTDVIIIVAANMTSLSYLAGLGAVGLTEVECIAFNPAEGRTGIWPAGVRVIRWKEIK